MSPKVENLAQCQRQELVCSTAGGLDSTYLKGYGHVMIVEAVNVDGSPYNLECN
ncbi:CHAP domain-containing protein [Streptococcus macedonicus]|uniref:CHAP domain-containing protein n=1 Tax=Streptococcus macedonicus TaxID=59310 RepID=A0AA47FDD4_STRMC|nr:CHAP domain-containing protein [Streptococcus macedonicus]WAK63932.1 CHAP domain-containing protein [Streptococcus macedonicus]